MNVSLPFDKDDTVDRAPWPHVDQSPMRRFKHCIQGIMNLVSRLLGSSGSLMACDPTRWQYENGPHDGGLMVLEGSFGLYNAFFDAHEADAPPGGWSKKDSFNYKPEHLQWFYNQGCRWKKVEAGPGDVILWDSRCIHYGAAAEGDRPRVATCELSLLPYTIPSQKAQGGSQMCAISRRGTRRRSWIKGGESAWRITIIL